MWWSNVLSQIIIYRLTLSAPCKILFGPTTKQNIMVYFPAPSIFRWILHHYNLSTYLNDHRKNSSHNYIIFLYVLFTFTLYFIFFSENNDIINSHAYHIIYQIWDENLKTKQYILIPPKLTQIWYFIFI